MSFTDSEMHIVAGVGACILTAALSVPTIMFPRAASGNTGTDDTDKVVIEASLAMRKSPKKQPQKQFRQPDAPDKPQGVSRDDKKVVENQCCTDEADCNKAGLALGTTCPGDMTCENHRCKKKKRDTKEDDKDDKLATAIPDRTKSLDDPKGNPTENTVGEFDGSQKGTANTSSGDPWLRELANDLKSRVTFPKIEVASEAHACLRILEDGTIKDTKLDPRSDNDGFNANIDNAMKQLKDKRKEKPSAVPTHLLKQVVTKWTCIPFPAQGKQD
jgi:hypothetical protein